MDKKLLSGNEAIAIGFWEAGGHFASAYPGTPSTEILENLGGFRELYAEWAPNEKAAVEAAYGAALAGARALAAMKHVGLNVAADPLFTAAYTGIEGALVIVTADDPSMHSSQNEQDNRRYAKAAKLPILEPSDSQEALDMVKLALNLSEEHDIPVLLRITTRIAHTKTPVVSTWQRQERPLRGDGSIDWRKYVMMPMNARKRRVDLAERLARLREVSNEGSVNKIEWRDKGLGIITNGITYQYVREVFPDASVLKIGMVHPFPDRLAREFASGVKELWVIEELDRVIEEEVRFFGIEVHKTKPAELEIGELSPERVRVAFLGRALETKEAPAEPPSRPPNLCPGCPHTALFYNLKRRRALVFGDIGCYTLGALPPLSAMHTTLCMGASITTAFGFSKARPELAKKAVAVIGDSTFFHMGPPGIIEMAYNKGANTVVILDNRTTAMTGHQVHPGMGTTLQGEKTVALLPEDLVKAVGIEHVKVVDAYDVKGIGRALKEAMEHEGPSVLVVRGECVLLPSARKRWSKLPKYRVLADACAGEKCKLCMRLGCPAIFKSEEGKAVIDPLLCTSCSLCAQVCPYDAIKREDEIES